MQHLRCFFQFFRRDILHALRAFLARFGLRALEFLDLRSHRDAAVHRRDGQAFAA